MNEQKELMRDLLFMSTSMMVMTQRENNLLLKFQHSCIDSSHFQIHLLKQMVGKIYQQIVKPVPEWSTYNHACVEKLSVKNEKNEIKSWPKKW